jgi:hypothetical protein
LCGGDLVIGDLIRLFESTVRQITSLSEQSSRGLLLVCGILVLTRINGDKGDFLICFVAAVLDLDDELITKTDKVRGIGWPWFGNDRERSAVV